MNRNLVAVGVVVAFCTLLLIGGCSMKLHPYDTPSDIFGPVRQVERTCDFGILRGTKSMWCSEELKRKEWFLWT